MRLLCLYRYLTAVKRLPSDKRESLLLEKQTHMDVAISQRCTVSTFVNEFVK